MFGYVPLHNWSHEWWPIIPPVSCKAVAQKAAEQARDPLRPTAVRQFPSLQATHQRNKYKGMATGNSSAALLVVTGLISVSMAALGFYYLQMSSKKTRTQSDSDTGVKANVAEVSKPSAAIPTKVRESPKTVETLVQKEVETPKQVVASPNETPKSSPAKTVDSPKKAEPLVLELPKPILATPESPKQTPASPKKVAESLKKESEPAVVELPKQTPASPIKAPASSKETVESPKKAPESPKKAPASPQKYQESPKKAPVSPKKTLASPKKVAESAPAIEELDAVTRKLSEDFIITQAATETASAFTDELLQESLENIALEQEEYVQVELTQSMTLSQSTPELINIEDVVAKDKEVVRASAATEDEESIVEEEEQEEEQAPTEPIESVEAANIESSVEEVEAPEALASPKSPNTTPASWEAIASSPVVKAVPAEETATPLELETPAETTESAEPLSINVPAENTETSAEDKDASSPVSSGGSSPGKRNRNRSKKSKSKRKKSKKHPKFKA
ncbi:hypothetical protein V7S43_008759 [Phytophthora oleae]|uniref:Uncharacterized protein n=1 Tax=Phytophthora oleae TaxID=2107226 RepID=A0ABD3FJD5_9STRA